MYIVFKGMGEWLDKDPSLKSKFQSTYRFVYRAAHDYALHMSNSVKQKGKVKIKVEFSEVILKQCLIDAFDDLLRLKNYHPTEEPNPIKEMSYIVYWLVRHKPIRLVSEDVIYNTQLSEIARTRLLFINEEFGVKLLINAAFEGGIEQERCKHMQVVGQSQIKYYKQFLLYYLTYRMDSAKSLEEIMLGCTIHPVWEVNSVIWDDPQAVEDGF